MLGIFAASIIKSIVAAQPTSDHLSQAPLRACVISFLGIGLSMRFAEPVTFGLRSRAGFTIGVPVLSSHWSQIQSSDIRSPS